MTHTCGPVVTVGTRIGPDTGPETTPGTWELDFAPRPALMGGDPRFVILHFTNLDFPGTSRLDVTLGYGTDTFTAASGPDGWTRPIDPRLGPIRIRYFGSGTVGGVTLAEYGSGEPTQTGTPPGTPGNPDGKMPYSITNVDLFLHTNPYVEPTYETRLRCGTFDWDNAACAPAGSVEERAAKAVCCFVMVHYHHEGVKEVSTCSGTLIDHNLVLTASHCAVASDKIEFRSGSVVFGYQTACDRSRPLGYAPKIFKVTDIVRRGISDWLIMEIDTSAGGTGITPATLRPNGVMTNESLIAIHHPHGAVKKFQRRIQSFPTVEPAQGFDFAGGSSGSPIFDEAGLIVGGALSVGPVKPPMSPPMTPAHPCFAVSTPATTIIQELANPPTPPTPFDVMLVMDRSGSMASLGLLPGRTKMREARDAASLFVQLVRMNAGDRVGMVSFDTSASRPPDSPLGLINAAKKLDLVGPDPFTSGRIGMLAPGSMTSIGDGLTVAVGELTPAGTNQRAILLMTDGLENTPPMIAHMEATLGTIKLIAIGFGAESSLNGALLSRVATAHNGLYNRANDGLELMKFFSLAFGNIFESGALSDPYLSLQVDQVQSAPHQFDVCEEERITAIVGCDNPSQALILELRTPGGVTVGDWTVGIESDRGETWQFLRVTLPLNGEREGAWQWSVRRIIDAELPTAQETVRAFVAVVASGGPRLEPIAQRTRIYTGDPLAPLVSLRYANGTRPQGEVMLEIEAPNAPVGELVADAGLSPPQTGGDPLSAFHATLQSLAGGGEYVLPTRQDTIALFDDGTHGDGAMEPDGIFGNQVIGATRFEGTYRFRAIATYGTNCRSVREAQWAVHVALGVDPTTSTIVLIGQTSAPGGARGGRLVITPRDRYGNRLGPGRTEEMPVIGGPGTTPATVIDNGDGSYTVDVTWAPTVADKPSVVISQPDRPPLTLVPDAGASGPQGRGCRSWVWVLLVIVLIVLVGVLVLTI